jgi:large subunit ribosomal protein L25
MNTITINVNPRKDLGKKHSRKLRNNNQVPGVIYGGKEIVHFYAHENDFRHIIYTHHAYLVNLSINGKIHQAILKEAQFHPVSDKLLHIDFVEVAPDKPVIVNLPVDLVGSSVGVREGGKLRLRKRYVRVKGLASDIPDMLQIDITDLGIGHSVLAGDLTFDKFEILEPKRAAVVSVISSRAAAKSFGEEPVEAAPAAGAEETAAAAETTEGGKEAGKEKESEQPKK